MFSRQPKQRQSIELRQADVGQHDIELQRRHQLEGLIPVVRRVHLVTGVAQPLRARQVEIGLVVDQQNAEGTPKRGVGHFCCPPSSGGEGGRNKGGSPRSSATAKPTGTDNASAFSTMHTRISCLRKYRNAVHKTYWSSESGLACVGSSGVPG